MAKRNTYTEQDFIVAVQSSFSWAESLRKLGLKPAGGNYSLAKDRVRRLGLNVEHFTGSGHLKGKHNTWHPQINLSLILVENSTYTNSSKLRQRLVKEGLLVYKCGECGLSSWRGNPLSLELEHINGKNKDHRIENLKLLCPNCHSQTSTWRGRNKKLLDI